MSKESYARGFCKVAAAAGVDPVQLAKFAQKSKTDGWAPAVVSRIGKERAPMYGYDNEGNGPNGQVQLIEKAEPIESASDVFRALRLSHEGVSTPNENENRITATEPRAAIDPTYKAWLSAHRRALDDINNTLAPLFYDNAFSYVTPNPSLAASIAKAYHDSMAKIS